MHQIEVPPVSPGVSPEGQPAEIAAPGVAMWQLMLLALAMAGFWLFFRRGWYKLRRVPRRPLAFSSPVGIALLLGAVVLAPAGVLLVRAALGIDIAQGLDLRELALLAIGRYAGEVIVVIAFAVLVLKARRPVPDRRLGIPAAIAFGLAALLLFWTFTVVASWLVNVASYFVRGSMPEPIAHELLAQLIAADRTLWFVVMAAITVVVAPIFEEVIYRGVLQELLGRLDMPRWWAIFGTSVVFTIMHIGAAPSAETLLPMLAALFVLSLGFGWAYERTGRLLAPITMHVLFNAGNLTVAMWGA